MPRTYSKTGCIRCKMRKKKCTEERPACAACVRWGWLCEYESSPPPRDEVAVVAPPRLQPRASVVPKPFGLPPRNDSEVEYKLLRLIPERIKIYYAATSNQRLTNLQTMFQLMSRNKGLRHAIVACFSVAGSTDALTKLNRVAYGQALESLRSKVLLDSLDQEDRICVMTSIAFLGKMESFGPNSLADQLEHWVAFIPLLENKKMLEMMEKGTIPFNEAMLIVESLLFHVATDAMFSRNLDRVWHLWRTHGTYERIRTLNPEGPDRLSLSPLLAGQYELYDLALQITHLYQCHHEDHISSHLASELEAKVRLREVQLGLDFFVSEPGAIGAAKYKAERAVYQLFCNSLLILITALRESSRAQRIQMRKLVTSGNKLFSLELSCATVPALANHVHHFTLAAIWPVQIQGCALYDGEELRVLLENFATMEKYLDRGHLKRALTLFDGVSKLLPQSRSGTPDEDTDAPPLPPGLTVLRQAVRFSPSPSP